MNIIIDHNVTVTELKDGSVIVTRPTIMGKIASHIIKSPYKAIDIAAWLSDKMGYSLPLAKGFPVIQLVFPDMKEEDREFLLSGITPDVWARLFVTREDA